MSVWNGPRRARRRALSSVAATALFVGGIAGAEAAEPSRPSDAWAEFAEREHFTGDWGGARTRLEEAGVSFEAEYTGDPAQLVGGGVRRGGGFTGLIQLGLDLDLEKLAGWSGAEVHAGSYFIFGNGLSTYRVGNLISVSSNEADEAARLAEVYFKQSLFDGRFSVKIGQLAADSDFMTSETGGHFVVTNFGWPVLNGAVLPNGGPGYPTPVPAVVVAFAPTGQLSFQGGLYSGDPLGRSQRNDHNLKFPLGPGVTLFGEAALKTDAVWALPGVVKIGAWGNTNDVDDRRYAANGLSLAAPGADEPRSRSGVHAFYGVLDQTLWRESDADDARAVSLVVRGIVAPQASRSYLDRSLDVGVTLKKPFASRPDDVFGLGLGYVRVSKSARGLDRDAIAFGATAPVHSSEMAFEASYKAAVAGWLNVQPFGQYILRPGAGDADPKRPSRRIRDATVVGVRTQVSF